MINMCSYAANSVLAGGPVVPRADLLAEFAVSTNGFVPEHAPLRTLRDPYYAPWERLINSLSASLQAGSFRSQADELPVLSTEHLKGEAEWRRANVILGFLSNAYIWGGAQPAEVLPSCLSVPLIQVCRHLELPPVATYACLVLWNFCSTSASSASPPRQDFSNLDKLQALHTFTGTEDESWFYAVSVAMESQGGTVVIPAAMDTLEALGRRDFSRMAACLDALSASIVTLTKLLERMYEKCSPQVFYHQIRPFVAGSKNMAMAGLPRGVFYPFPVASSGESDDGEEKEVEAWWGSSSSDMEEEEVDKKYDSGMELEEGEEEEATKAGRWLQLRGGSNGQSSLIMLLDVVLGVEHGSKGEGGGSGGCGGSGGTSDVTSGGTSGGTSEGQRPHDTMGFHQETRWYMPGAHRRFLGKLATMGNLHNLAVEIEQQQQQQQQQQAGDGHHNTQSDVGPRVFVEAYKRAVKTLGELRQKHLQVVTRYIIIPSRKAGQPKQGGEDNKTRAGPVVVTNLATVCTDTVKKTGLTGTAGTALVPFLKQARDETYETGELKA